MYSDLRELGTGENPMMSSNMQMDLGGLLWKAFASIQRRNVSVNRQKM